MREGKGEGETLEEWLIGTLETALLECKGLA